jgi:hypothetical protein
MMLILFWFGFAIVVGVFANQRRNRSGFGWFLLSLLISPLLAGLFVACLKPPEPSEREKAFGFGVKVIERRKNALGYERVVQNYMGDERGRMWRLSQEDADKRAAILNLERPTSNIYYEVVRNGSQGRLSPWLLDMRW